VQDYELPFTRDWGVWKRRIGAEEAMKLQTRVRGPKELVAVVLERVMVMVVADCLSAFVKSACWRRVGCGGSVGFAGGVAVVGLLELASLCARNYWPLALRTAFFGATY
jgi:hypothetical protein